MSLTKVAFVGDGSTTRFAFSFPYLAKNHVKVYVNTQGQARLLAWDFASDSEIEFFSAPVADAVVEIRRVTDRTNRLVDFENGSVLTEEELDLAHKQHFYTSQELQEEFSQLLGDGLQRFASSDGVFTGDVQQAIDAVVAEVLASQLYVDLQARINDIDLNAQGIISISADLSDEVVNRQSQFNTLAAQIDLVGEGVSDQTSALAAADAQLTASVSLLDGQLSAQALDLSTLQTAVGDQSTLIQQQAVSLDGVEAQYTVKIDNNGYVTGFGLASSPAQDGTPFSEFIVRADRFAVGAAGVSDQVPFVVQNGRVYIDSAFIRELSADVLTSGTVNANRLAIDNSVLDTDGQGRLTVNGIPFSLVTGSDRPEAEATRGVINTHIAQSDGQVNNASTTAWGDAQMLEFTLERTTEVLLEFTAMFRRVGNSSTTFGDVRILKDGSEIGGLSAAPIFIGGTSFQPFSWRTRAVLPAGTHIYKLQFKSPQSGVEIGAFARVITATETR